MRRWLYWSTGAGAACVALALLFWYQPWSPALGETDSVLLTDFENRTGEPVFDGTLKHALAMHLGQTPFFNIFPEEWARETLRYMGRAADEHVGVELGREICLRRGIKAMLGGSIAKLGRTYVISLEALNGHTGEVIAREQVQAASEELVLQELGRGATNLRRKLGESLKSIQRFDVPLEQATTRSLAAFNAYSAGRRKLTSGLTSEAIPHYQRALEADPNFASAYDDLAWCYAARSDNGMAAECATKAYALRDRVSEYERLSIDTIYRTMVTDEKSRAIETLEMMRTVYPRSPSVHNTLGNMYADTGQFQKSEAAYREAIRLRRYPNAYGGLARVCFRLNRVKEAKDIIAEAAEQGIDNRSLRFLRYHIAFSEGDRGAMVQQVQWALGKPAEAFMLALQGDAAAHTGRMDEARTFYRQAIESAGKHQLKNAAAQFAASAALWEACGGNCGGALQYLGSAEAAAADSGLALRHALTLALCGKPDEAAALADGVDRKCSGQAWARQATLPVVRAAIALSRGEPSAALGALGVPSQRPAWNALWPRYLAGESYRRLGMLKEARTEFQYVLSHLSLESLSPICSLARLGLARAEAASGDKSASGRAYQELFSQWNRADPDLPVFRQALAEYSSRTTRAQN